jgi:hypothetical protein
VEVVVVYFKVYLFPSPDLLFVMFFISYIRLKMSPLRLGREVLTEVQMITNSGREQKKKTVGTLSGPLRVKVVSMLFLRF